MPESPVSSRRKNNDVKCLKCGAFNIHENRICGRCGANLPIIYDEQGQVFRWEEAQGYESLVKKPVAGPRVSVGKTRWILRALILVIALLFALYLKNAHH
jgi:ribosomal protein L40E